MVTPDETGWRVGGRLHWLRALATPTTTVYVIRAGRGFPEAASILGADFGDVIVPDGWAATGSSRGRRLTLVWRICSGGAGC
jgi:hypothetical protein